MPNRGLLSRDRKGAGSANLELWPLGAHPLEPTLNNWPQSNGRKSMAPMDFLARSLSTTRSSLICFNHNMASLVSPKNISIPNGCNNFDPSDRI